MKLGYYFILLHRKMKNKTVQKHPTHTMSCGHLSKHQVGFLSFLKLYTMAQLESVEAQSLKYQKVEELFEYRDVEIFDTIMSNGPIDAIKQKLKLLKYQGTDIHNIYQSYFHFFRY